MRVAKDLEGHIVMTPVLVTGTPAYSKGMGRHSSDGRHRLWRALAGQHTIAAIMTLVTVLVFSIRLGSIKAGESALGKRS